MKIKNTGKVLKCNRKILEISKFDTPNTQIHNRPLSWLGTDTSVKSDGVIVVLLAQNLSSCKAQKNENFENWLQLCCSVCKMIIFMGLLMDHQTNLAISFKKGI